MNKNSLLVILYSLCVAGALYFIEQSVGVSYALKTALKIVLFLVIPFVYVRFFAPRAAVVKRSSSSISFRKLLPGILVGAFSFVAIMVVYALLAQHIDLASIALELQTKLGITPINFIFIGIYITLVNSLLEEYFFRNFIFLRLFGEGKRLVAYLYSSVLFALYHMAIFGQWFDASITALCLLGLFVIGLVWCRINSGSGHFYNSWIAHMLADVAVIIIGLRMFGIV